MRNRYRQRWDAAAARIGGSGTIERKRIPEWTTSLLFAGLAVFAVNRFHASWRIPVDMFGWITGAIGLLLLIFALFMALSVVFTVLRKFWYLALIAAGIYAGIQWRTREQMSVPAFQVNIKKTAR